MSHAPLIETERLILRSHRADDLDACLALWGDRSVVRHIGGLPLDRQAVWFRILRYAGCWALLGYGMWAVEEKASGMLVGEAGLLNALRGLPQLEGVPEAGWVLGPAAWGKGYATEAMAAALGWADAHLDAASIRCMIEPGHEASIKVAGKLGFVKLARTTLLGEAVLVFDRAQGLVQP